MTGSRHLAHRHWIAAMAIVVAALLARMMIPTGYMPMVENGHVLITLCAEQNPGMARMAAMPGMTQAQMADTGHSGDHDAPGHDKSGACGFGGLSLGSLAAIDPDLLALAILFLFATVFRRPECAPVASRRFLWPPRTGPPLGA